MKLILRWHDIKLQKYFCVKKKQEDGSFCQNKMQCATATLHSGCRKKLVDITKHLLTKRKYIFCSFALLFSVLSHLEMLMKSKWDNFTLFFTLIGSKYGLIGKCNNIFTLNPSTPVSFINHKRSNSSNQLHLALQVETKRLFRFGRMKKKKWPTALQWLRSAP